MVTVIWLQVVAVLTAFTVLMNVIPTLALEGGCSYEDPWLTVEILQVKSAVNSHTARNGRAGIQSQVF